jgi:hypothetical protein
MPMGKAGQQDTQWCRGGRFSGPAATRSRGEKCKDK